MKGRFSVVCIFLIFFVGLGIVFKNSLSKCDFPSLLEIIETVKSCKTRLFLIEDEKGEVCAKLIVGMTGIRLVLFGPHFKPQTELLAVKTGERQISVYDENGEFYSRLIKRGDDKGLFCFLDNPFCFILFVLYLIPI
jgi:hypothetical protein